LNCFNGSTVEQHGTGDVIEHVRWTWSW